jgi:hypothetical protein
MVDGYDAYARRNHQRIGLLGLANRGECELDRTIALRASNKLLLDHAYIEGDRVRFTMKPGIFRYGEVCSVGDNGMLWVAVDGLESWALQPVHPKAVLTLVDARNYPLATPAL